MTPSDPTVALLARPASLRVLNALVDADGDVVAADEIADRANVTRKTVYRACYHFQAYGIVEHENQRGFAAVCDDAIVRAYAELRSVVCDRVSG